MSDVFCTFADAEIYSARRPRSGAGYVSFSLCVYIMAIVNSLAIGKSVKSAGNLTYKTVRGRTIASQRITTNKSNTQKQIIQRDLFGNVSKSLQLCQSYIDKCYEKSKYGSARNDFQKTNPKFTLYGFVGEIKEGIEKLAYGFVGALSKPDYMPRQISYITKGSLPCIVNMDVQTYATYNCNAGEFQNVNYINGEAVYNFPSPYKIEEISLAIVVLLDNSFAIANVAVGEDGTITLETGNETADTDLAQFEAKATVSNGVVSSISVKNANPEITMETHMVIIVPTVGGKVPNTFAAFMPKNTEEPLP